jgi:hypothetical protein
MSDYSYQVTDACDVTGRLVEAGDTVTTLGPVAGWPHGHAVGTVSYAVNGDPLWLHVVTGPGDQYMLTCAENTRILAKRARP